MFTKQDIDDFGYKNKGEDKAKQNMQVLPTMILPGLEKMCKFFD